MTETGALHGIRIVDLTRVLGGPYCTQILGDHGADVIKVEPPAGDETREWGPPFVEGEAAYFLGTNRNKRSIVLDLSTEAGREVLLALLAGADVLIENFKPGTLARWGLDYRDVLAPRFPHLIHCAITGFGADGPRGGLPGYDAAIQAEAGLMSINGTPDGPPTRIGVPIVDLVTGLNAAIGILLALNERTKSGKGQSIDVALYDCAISVMHPHMTNFLASGAVPVRTGSGHPNIVPYDSFPTRTAPLFLAVGNDGQFAKLARLLGRADLARDPRFRTNPDRVRARIALRAELEALLASHDCEVLAKTLIRNGVPCAPVRTVDQVLADPHTAHRAMRVTLDGYEGIGAPVKLSRSPARYRRKPPRLGEHTDEILKDLPAKP